MEISTPPRNWTLKTEVIQENTTYKINNFDFHKYVADINILEYPTVVCLLSDALVLVSFSLRIWFSNFPFLDRLKP